MDLITKLNQTAVYWAFSSKSGWGGANYSTAVERSVRWEQKQELFNDNKGEQKLSNAIIYANGDDTYALDGYLFLGELTDLDSNHDNPETISNAFRIQVCNKSSNVDNTDSLWKIIL